MSNLFEASAWTGEFFIPNRFDARFAGTIQYSAADAVVLTYRMADEHYCDSTEVLHGILNTGDKCTLFGNFSPANGGWTLRNGLHTRNGEAGFKALAMGDWLPVGANTTEIHFSVTGLQEFFRPRGSMRLADFGSAATKIADLPFGRVDLTTRGKGELLTSDIAAAVHCHDQTAMAALVDAFNNVVSQFPKSFFAIKKEVEYYLRLSLGTPTAVFDAFDYVTLLSEFFALLFDAPTHPDKVSMLFAKPDGERSTVELYPSLGLNAKTIELSMKRRSPLDMPFHGSALHLEPLLQNWCLTPRKYSILVSAIQHEVGFRTDHTAHGELVLYASQLESIAHDAGHARDKYSYPIATHGTPKLLRELEQRLSVAGSNAVGIAIGDLRNEVAHVGRPKTLLSRLSLRQLIDITRCLQLVLAGYVLESLGMQRANVERYIDSGLPVTS